MSDTKPMPSWLPMKDAPITPETNNEDIGVRHSKAIALLCWYEDDYVLIRGCWLTLVGGGAWIDLDSMEPIDCQIVGWMPLPTEEERKALLRP
jgi:hypothetical protein